LVTLLLATSNLKLKAQSSNFKTHIGILRTHIGILRRSQFSWVSIDILRKIIRPLLNLESGVQLRFTFVSRIGCNTPKFYAHKKCVLPSLSRPLLRAESPFLFWWSFLSCVFLPYSTSHVCQDGKYNRLLASIIPQEIPRRPCSHFHKRNPKPTCRPVKFRRMQNNWK